MSGPKFYVFTDFETTGLDANRDVILEGAIAVVDVEKRETVDMFSSIIHEDNHEYLRAVNRAIYGEDQFVNNMHHQSGLWDAWNSDDVTHLSRAAWAAKAIELMDRCGVSPQSAPMAGNSVGSLDRPFALRQMRDFSDWLSHRNFDVSTLRAWVEANKPELEKEWINQTRRYEEVVHRAATDVYMSIQQWKFYTEGIMK